MQTVSLLDQCLGWRRPEGSGSGDVYGAGHQRPTVGAARKVVVIYVRVHVDVYDCVILCV